MKSSKRYVVREVKTGTFHVRKRPSGNWRDAAVVPPTHATKTGVPTAPAASGNTAG